MRLVCLCLNYQENNTKYASKILMKIHELYLLFLKPNNIGSTVFLEKNLYLSRAHFFQKITKSAVSSGKCRNFAFSIDFFENEKNTSLGSFKKLAAVRKKSGKNRRLLLTNWSKKGMRPR